MRTCSSLIRVLPSVTLSHSHLSPLCHSDIIKGSPGAGESTAIGAMGRRIAGRLTDGREVRRASAECTRQAETLLKVFPPGPMDRQWGQKDRQPSIQQEGHQADRGSGNRRAGTSAQETGLVPPRSQAALLASEPCLAQRLLSSLSSAGRAMAFSTPQIPHPGQ